MNEDRFSEAESRLRQSHGLGSEEGEHPVVVGIGYPDVRAR